MALCLWGKYSVTQEYLGYTCPAGHWDNYNAGLPAGGHCIHYYGTFPDGDICNLYPTQSTQYGPPIQGTYLTTVTAEANTYPQNGRHSDGFWYTYLGLANKAPIISGTDTDLGTVTELLHKYSISDTDPSDVVTVTERLDGVQLRTFTATREVEYTISILAESGNFTASKRTNLDSGDSEEGAGLACWVDVLNGAHKLTITATDNIGASAVRTVSFTKAEHELEFTLQTPLAADDLVTKTIMSITRQLPVGALMQIYVCNNGFDEAPTWEDITAKVEQGDKFFFANTVKTADKWGYNLRVCVQRLGAEGTVSSAALGGIMNKKGVKLCQNYLN